MKTEALEDKLQQILQDPDTMAQIMSMAQSFGLQGFGSSKEEAQKAAPPPPPPPEADFVRGIMGLMQQAQQSDSKQEALLCALKPFLRPERRASIDRAMELARISNLAGIALRNYGGLTGQKGE